MLRAEKSIKAIALAVMVAMSTFCPVRLSTATSLESMDEDWQGIYMLSFKLSNQMKKSAVFLFLVLPLWVCAQSADEYFELGYNKYESDDYQGAIEAYSKAIDLSPDNPELYYHRGLCKSLLDMNEEAIKDFDVAISKDPGYAEVWFERAYSKYLLDMNDESIADYDQAIVLDPAYGNAYFNRGTVKFELGLSDQACTDWKKALELGITIASQLVTEYCDQ